MRAGKARYLGASSMYAWQFAEMLHVAERRGWTRFGRDAESLQPGLPRGGARDAAALPRRGHRGSSPGAPSRAASSPATGPAPARPAARRAGTRSARGRTSTTQGLYYAESDFRVVDRVVEIAGRRGVTPAGVALAWILRQPGVAAPIIGATKIGHLDDAVAALDLTLDDDECRRLEEPYVPHPVLGHR